MTFTTFKRLAVSALGLAWAIAPGTALAQPTDEMLRGAVRRRFGGQGL